MNHLGFSSIIQIHQWMQTKKISSKFSLHEMLFNSWLLVPASKCRQLRLGAERPQCFRNWWKWERKPWELLPPVEQLLTEADQPPLRTAATAQGPGPLLSSALHDGQGTLLPWVGTELDFPPWKDQHIKEDAARDGRGSVRENASHCAAAEWFVPLQELCKVIAFSEPWWEWIGQFMPLKAGADTARLAWGYQCHKF